ncbi:MAG: hypothetical protein Q9213_003521 [Squamulea squamosa]
MTRAKAYGSDEEEPRASGRRDRDDDDFDEEDQPAYEHEKPPRRSKSNRQAKSRHVAAEEEDEEDEKDKEDEEDEEDEEDKERSDEDDDRHKKQLVVRGKSRNKGKSSGREVARRKHKDSASEEESSEEEPKRKSKKGKSSKEETLKIDKWEVVHQSNVDADFVEILVRELDQNKKKIFEGIERGYLRCHTINGEYNIDKYFEKGIFSERDKKNWTRIVKKRMASPQLKQGLFNSAKTGEIVDSPMMHMGMMGGSYRGSSMGGHYLMDDHARFEPRCPDCRSLGHACAFY